MLVVISQKVPSFFLLAPRTAQIMAFSFFLRCTRKALNYQGRRGAFRITITIRRPFLITKEKTFLRIPSSSRYPCNGFASCSPHPRPRAGGGDASRSEHDPWTPPAGVRSIPCCCVALSFSGYATSSDWRGEALINRSNTF